MASSSSMKTCLVLLFVLVAATTGFAAPEAIGSPPSPVKCIHHHAKLTACPHYLEDDVKFPKPTEACCQNYNEIFRSGTPTCLCRYLHPEKLRTWFSVTKLMSLHDVCQSSSSTTIATVPLYDLCVGLQDPQEKFDGILQVVNKDHPKNPFMPQAHHI